MFKLSLKSTKRTEFIDVTDEVQNLIEDKGFCNGHVIVYVPHTTAAVTINEGADPAVQQDILKKLNQLVPLNENYLHAEGNSDAHIKASLLGASEYILVENGLLQLGTWQHVFFFEGDGPRNRTVYVGVFPLK
jgi:secondary thiamine-phosphate synthase enzyme